MGLADIFTLFGIISMTLFLFLCGALVVTLVSILRQLTEVGKILGDMLEVVKDAIANPKLTALKIFGSLTQKAVTKVQDFVRDVSKKEVPQSSSLFSLVKEAANGWKNDNAGVWCAALAYYTTFSIGPLLLIVISVTGLILNNTGFEKDVYAQLSDLLGSQGAGLLHTLAESSQKESSNIWGTIIGVIILLFGVSGLFGQLQQMLNAIWGVKQKPSINPLGMLRNRIFNMSMIGVLVFLLLVSLLASTVIASLGSALNNLISGSAIVISMINILFSFLLVMILFGFIFKVLPNVRLRWRNVWMGAFISAILFSIGKELISIYIGRTGVASQYGAAGSLIVLLLWVFYSTQILFFGVEFTKAVTLSKEGQIIPSKSAMLEEEG